MANNICCFGFIILEIVHFILKTILWNAKDAPFLSKICWDSMSLDTTSTSADPLPLQGYLLTRYEMFSLVNKLIFIITLNNADQI